MIAICTIRRLPEYRVEAFESGLQRAGYKLVSGGRPSGPEDLLVLWNRQGAAEATANTWEHYGGTVIVCENGYMGRDEQGRQFYAIGVHGHNGAGWFPVGNEDRFQPLDLDVKPWREDPGYDLVCGQRGIGSVDMRSPPGWHTRTASRLMASKRNVKLRLHPGNKPPATKLEDDLAGAGTCVIWSSSSGVVALLKGIPVAYFAPNWICAAGARKGFEGVSAPLKDDAARLAALKFAAWGQRSVAEIETGEPFVRIRDEIGNATW